jgi:hypothetical protein
VFPSSPNDLTAIKSRTYRAGHVARMGQIKKGGNWYNCSKQLKEENSIKYVRGRRTSITRECLYNCANNAGNF